MFSPLCSALKVCIFSPYLFSLASCLEITHSVSGSGWPLIRHLLQEPVNHSPWPPSLLCSSHAPPCPSSLGSRGDTGSHKSLSGRTQFCPELWNPGLLAVTENTVSKDGERTHKAPPLAEKLLAVDGCWGKESFLVGVATVGYPCSCG